MVKNLSASEVKTIMSSKNNIRLIDVREEWEFNIAKIENAELMPLSIFMSFINNLNKDDSLIVYCHHGVRSLNVCNYLVQNDFRDVSNLDGGIDAWSKEVDGSIPQY